MLERKIKCYHSLQNSLINKVVTRGLNPNVSMKQSEIPFLNEIPEHWHICRIKDLFNERIELSETGTEDLLSVSEYYGVAKRADKVDGENITRSDSLIGYKICYVNDIISNIMLAWKGSLGKTKYNGIVSPAYGVYKPINDNIGVFLHFYFMQSNNAFNYLHPLIQKGAKNTINITNARFLENSIPLPKTEDEVVYIANALTSIQTKIDLEKSLLCSYEKEKQYLLRQMFI